MSAYRGGGRDGGRQEAASGDGAGNSFRSESNGFFGGGRGAMRSERSAANRRSRFGPYSKVDANDARSRDNHNNHRTWQSRSTPGGYQILISNMRHGVRATELKDLFSKYGPLKEVTVHYDRFGRSLGTAYAVFHSRDAALKAVFHSNCAHIDGRPMKIELITDLLTIADRAARFSRPATMPVGFNCDVGDHGIRENPGNTGEASGYSRRSSARRTRRKILSKDELDAQLDSIMSNIK